MSLFDAGRVDHLLFSGGHPGKALLMLKSANDAASVPHGEVQEVLCYCTHLLLAIRQVAASGTRARPKRCVTTRSSGAAVLLPRTGECATLWWHITHAKPLQQLFLGTWLTHLPRRWVLEDRSRSTRENALFSVSIMAQHRSPHPLNASIARITLLLSSSGQGALSAFCLTCAGGDQRWW